MSIAMDDAARQCFIGDAGGIIHVVKIDALNKYEPGATLNGHTGR